MPELPEVETVRRTLLPYVVGQTIADVIVRDARLRFGIDTDALRRAVVGRTVLGVRRRAKYLLFDLDNGWVMLVHLGMSGKLGWVPAALELKTHDHVLWSLGASSQLRFNDPRRFGMVDVFAASDEARHIRLRHLGVEPLDAAFDAAMLTAATREVKKPIKNFIMDASYVVGVGNIYACEALFAAGIHPGRAAGRVSPGRIAALVQAIRETLEAAITLGGTTLRDFANVAGEAGYFAIRLSVYGREGEPCVRCARPILRMVQAGRSTFYCPRCQR